MLLTDKGHFYSLATVSTNHIFVINIFFYFILSLTLSMLARIYFILFVTAMDIKYVYIVRNSDKLFLR